MRGLVLFVLLPIWLVYRLCRACLAFAYWPWRQAGIMPKDPSQEPRMSWPW